MMNRAHLHSLRLAHLAAAIDPTRASRFPLAINDCRLNQSLLINRRLINLSRRRVADSSIDFCEFGLQANINPPRNSVQPTILQLLIVVPGLVFHL